MTIIDKMKDLLWMLAENIHKRRKVVLALSCVVVFVTTYMLILPAFTLEKSEAAEQGGIDVPGITATSEEVAEGETADAEAEQTDEAKGKDAKSETGEKEDGKAEESGPKESKDSDKAKEKDSDKSKSDASEKTAEPLTFKAAHYTIAVEDKNSVLPENTKIKVKEIDKNKDAKEYKNHFDDALAAIQEEKDGKNVSDLEFARFYDISLVSDGKEINPSGGDSVNVSIQYDEQLRKALGVENKDNIRIIHFAENKNTGKVEAEVLNNKEAKVEINTDKKDQLKEASFEAESFSVYAVVYTVDFEYEDESTHEAYKYSMEGGSSITLKKLAVILGITAKDKADEFIANVEDVKFSDEKLVKVEKTENGWTLKSLKDFDTTETLTITMKDGKVYEVKVTDAQGSYTININTYDYDTTTPKAPDSEFPINGNYYLRVKIQEKDGVAEDGSQKWKDAGWTAIPVGNITGSTQSFTFNSFVLLDKNYKSTENQKSFDPEVHRVDISDGQSIRLIKPLQSYWENNFQNACSSQAIDDSAPDKYNYIAGAGDETTSWTVKLARAKDIDYNVRLKFDGASSLDDVSGFDNKPGSLYALVTVGHKSQNGGNPTYTYGLVKITDSMKKVLDDGSIVVDAPITQWVDFNGNILPNEKYTGHELSTTVNLIGIPDSVSNVKPSDLYNNEGGNFKYNTAVVKEENYVNNYEVSHLPTTQKEPDRVKEDNPSKPHTDNVYDVVTLKKDSRTFDGYNLEYVLNDYNLVTLCPNGKNTHYGSDSSGGQSQNPSNGVYTDGDVFLVTHAMGAVLIRGDLIIAGGTGVADSEIIEKISVVGGKVLNSGTGTPGEYGVHTGQAVNTRAKETTPEKYRPDFFVGEENTVYGSVINGVNIAEPSLNVRGTTISSGSYIDWDTLQTSMINASESLYDNSTEEIHVSGASQVVEITAGQNVTLVYDNPDCQVSIKISGDVDSKEKGTIINLSGNNIKLPIIQTINGQAAAEYLTDPAHQVEGGSNKEDGSGMSVVFNAPNTTNLTVTSTDIIGHVLAPRADVRLLGGNYNGCVIANSIYTAAEGHRWPYNGPKGSLVPTKAGFEAEKLVNGAVPTSDQKYWFMLEEFKADETTGEWSWTGIQRKENAGKQIAFDEITYRNAGDLGMHYYRVKEDAESVGSGVTPDDSVYIYAVNVQNTGTETDIHYESTETIYKLKDPTDDPISYNENTGKVVMDENKGDLLGAGDNVRFNNKFGVTLNIIKDDRIDHTKMLSGAVFKITQLDENGQGSIKEGGIVNTSEATDANGKTSFSNLSAGYYQIEETVRPTGYVMTDDKIFYIKVDNGNISFIEKTADTVVSQWPVKTTSETDDIRYSPDTKTVTVDNEQGTELPMTGGIGTVIFYVLGSILVIGGGIYFISRRRAMK